MKDEFMDKNFRFPCDRWLSKNDDDGQIMRELACANNDYLDLNEKTSKFTRRFYSVFSNHFTIRFVQNFLFIKPPFMLMALLVRMSKKLLSTYLVWDESLKRTITLFVLS